MNNKTKQILAVLALAAFLIFSIFGTLDLIVTSHHECSGIHCLTCKKIAAVQHTLRTIQCAVVGVWLSVSLCRCSLRIKTMPIPIHFLTAVSLKTKLNN